MAIFSSAPFAAPFSPVTELCIPNAFNNIGVKSLHTCSFSRLKNEHWRVVYEVLGTAFADTRAKEDGGCFRWVMQRMGFGIIAMRSEGLKRSPTAFLWPFSQVLRLPPPFHL